MLALVDLKMQVEATHLQLLLLPDHGVILGLEEARFPFQLGHDSCQLLIADLLAHNVLAVGINLVLNAALLLMLLCDCILQRLPSLKAVSAMLSVHACIAYTALQARLWSATLH